MVNKSVSDVAQLSSYAYKLRKMVLLSAKCSGDCGTSIITSSFSCAEILVTLYLGGVLKYRPENPKWQDRDRVYLSKGHAAPAYYSALAMAGFFPEEEAIYSGKRDSRVGALLNSQIPGVECTSGSCGQGLGIACGAAYAAKLNRENWLTFCISGDGELDEGAMWEAALFAGHHKLNNLVWIVDRNYMQCSDFTENTLSLQNLEEMISSFGFHVECINGHNCTELLEVFTMVRKRPYAKPICVIADTVKGKGLPESENNLLTHFYLPKEDAVEGLISQYIEPYITMEV